MTPDRILHDLHELWVTLGKQPPEGTSGVLRACTMTLIALADESEDPSAIWELLAALMPQHPSRAILIRFRRGGGREVDARVFAQCWQPFGQRRQICCEQVEISATDGSLADLPPLVTPLAAPDLPVVLYCRCPRLFASPHLRALAPAAGKLVVDSALFGDVPAALGMLAASRNGPALSDLAWTRVTPWRENVAGIFEDAELRSRLAGVSDVRVTGAGSAPAPEAVYLGAWLAGGVERAGGTVSARFETAQGEAAAEVHRVSLGGGGMDVAVELVEAGLAEIRCGRSVRHVSMPSRPGYAVLGEELSLTHCDPVYEEVLPAAARLAIIWSA